MNISMISGTHLTATNKRHIAQLISQNLVEGGTKALHYELINRDGDMFQIKVSKKLSNDWGKVYWHSSVYTVKAA
jgi:hypothetical protein